MKVLPHCEDLHLQYIQGEQYIYFIDVAAWCDTHMPSKTGGKKRIDNLQRKLKSLNGLKVMDDIKYVPITGFLALVFQDGQNHISQDIICKVAEILQKVEAFTSAYNTQFQYFLPTNASNTIVQENCINATSSMQQFKRQAMHIHNTAAMELANTTSHSNKSSNVTCNMPIQGQSDMIGEEGGVSVKTEMPIQGQSDMIGEEFGVSVKTETPIQGQSDMIGEEFGVSVKTEMHIQGKSDMIGEKFDVSIKTEMPIQGKSDMIGEEFSISATTQTPFQGQSDMIGEEVSVFATTQTPNTTQYSSPGFLNLVTPKAKAGETLFRENLTHQSISVNVLKRREQFWNNCNIIYLPSPQNPIHVC